MELKGNDITLELDNMNKLKLMINDTMVNGVLSCDLNLKAGELHTIKLEIVVDSINRNRLEVTSEMPVFQLGKF